MPPKEFRIALTAGDFEAAVAFYRDGLGLDPKDIWTSENGGTGQMFLAGQATLEIFDPVMPNISTNLKSERESAGRSGLRSR
jgi:hypothetical protein